MNKTNPKNLNQKKIKELVKEYQEKLQKDYDEHFLTNANTRKLGKVEQQLILSFIYPKSRNTPCWYNEIRVLGTSPKQLSFLDEIQEKKDISELEQRFSRSQNAYNYCMNCREFKTKENMTEKFCMENYDTWNDNYTNFNHKDLSCCFSCLKKMCSYGIDHEDTRYKPRCPSCNYRRKFHYLNYEDLTRSHPSRCYTIINLLPTNTTTTKKLNGEISKYGTDNGKNNISWINPRTKNRWCFNTNSYSWKISLLHNILATERENLFSYIDEEYLRDDTQRKAIRYIYPSSRRDDLANIFRKLRVKHEFINDTENNDAHDLTVNNMTDNANLNFRYNFDELNFRPTPTIHQEHERDPQYYSIKM